MKKKIILGLTLLFLSGCFSNTINQEPLAPQVVKDIPKEEEIIQERIVPEPQEKIYDKIKISFIDVDQGDSILIDGKQDMLIDCGDNNKGDDVRNYLNSQGIKELEYLVITHGDADHMGGCEEVLNNFNVKNIMLDGQVRTTSTYTDVIKLIDTENKIIAEKGESFNLGDLVFKIIHSNMGSSDTNQNSIVLRMDYNKFSALFTGDCDRDCETELLSETIDVDVLKVAHHCSKYGTSSVFVNKVTPEVAFIQVGEGNKYGHPNQECLDNLNNILVYRNDLNGNIFLETNGLTYEITTQKTSTAKIENIVETTTTETNSNSVINSNYVCSSNFYNCADFSSQSEAQKAFESCGGISHDVHDLDRDSDGIACESLK